MRKPTKIVSAPGRVCLFGEHSDYLGLPIIAMAIDKRLTISAYPRRDKKFRILMPDVGVEEIFNPGRPLKYLRQRDYLRAGVNVLRRKGYRFTQGYDFHITSTIPIRAGTSSSSALVVAWIRMLLSLHPYFSQFNPIEIALLAYETEVLEFGEPGGRMDHFAIACGDLLYLENEGPVEICFFKQRMEGMVLGDSKQKKETIENLRQNRKEVTSGFHRMKKVFKAFQVRRIPLKTVLKKFSPSDPTVKKSIATLRNRDICRSALRELTFRPHDFKRIGKLMSEHHHQLRRYLGISTPRIEAMIEAALGAGALGAKINGSGLGGTMIAYAPGREKQVITAIEKAGGDAWAVHQARGVVD